MGICQTYLSALIYEGNVFIYIEKNTEIRHKVDSQTYTGI